MIKDKETNRVYKIYENLDAMGSENEKVGAKATIELHDAWNNKQRLDHYEHVEMLEKRKKRRIFYNETLAKIAHDWFAEMDVPAIGFKPFAKYSKQGVGCFFKDPYGNVFGRAMRTTGEAAFDYDTIRHLVYECEEAMWVKAHKYDNLGAQTKSGVFLS